MKNSNLETAWGWITSQNTFTCIELSRATGLSLSQTRTVVVSLTRLGAVKQTSLRKVEHFKGGFRPKAFKAVTGASPLLVGKGGHTSPKTRRGTAQQLVWQSMRVLRTFTVCDLVATTGCSDSTARAYLSLLTKFGYVRRLPSTHMRLSNEQRVGQRSRYKLLKNTGPVAPKRQREGLWDANLKQEVSDVA